MLYFQVNGSAGPKGLRSSASQSKFGQNRATVVPLSQNASVPLAFTVGVTVGVSVSRRYNCSIGFAIVDAKCFIELTVVTH